MEATAPESAATEAVAAMALGSVAASQGRPVGEAMAPERQEMEEEEAMAPAASELVEAALAAEARAASKEAAAAAKALETVVELMVGALAVGGLEA